MIQISSAPQLNQESEEEKRKATNKNKRKKDPIRVVPSS